VVSSLHGPALRDRLNGTHRCGGILDWADIIGRNPVEEILLHFPLSGLGLHWWKGRGALDRGIANDVVGRLAEKQPGTAGGLVNE
jgi:hypothetical protein